MHILVGSPNHQKKNLRCTSSCFLKKCFSLFYPPSWKGGAPTSREIKPNTHTQKQKQHKFVNLKQVNGSFLFSFKSKKKNKKKPRRYIKSIKCVETNWKTYPRWQRCFETYNEKIFSFFLNKKRFSPRYLMVWPFWVISCGWACTRLQFR